MNCFGKIDQVLIRVKEVHTYIHTYIHTYVLLQLPKRAFQYNTTKRTIIQNKYMNILTLIFSKINIIIKLR